MDDKKQGTTISSSFLPLITFTSTSFPVLIQKSTKFSKLGLNSKLDLGLAL